MHERHVELDAEVLLKLEEQVAARMAALFRRCPALVGFTTGDWPTRAEELLALALERRLPVGDLGVFPLLGAEQREEIYDEIAGTLFDLLAAQPAAMVVLRGRTIVRALH